jgi:uncharacterized protein (TIGR02996 family)
MNGQLEAAIEADPDNPDGYLVLADWLQSQGDPRGELIVLQHASKTAEAGAHLAKHADHFWGKLAEFQDILQRWDYTPGYTRLETPQGPPTTWRWGHLEKLWISNKFGRDVRRAPRKPEVDIAKALGWLLEHPSTRFLRELTVGIVDFEKNHYEGAALAISNHSLPTLRKMYLGDFHHEETELNWSHAGDISPLYRAVPNLETLVVRSGDMKLGQIDLPNLRELVIISGGIDRGVVESICAATWPKLERLSIQLGQVTEFNRSDLQPILDGNAFPKLTHLGLGNSTITDNICEWLVTSAIARRLQSLDLSLGTMSDDGAVALTGSPRSRRSLPWS